jgi:MYXO-CTERM domain-containing protein
VDGVVASTGTINYSGTINNITLGGDTAGNYKLNSVVHSISMGAIVPEPATATLSLLALCGLAARRRRK